MEISGFSVWNNRPKDALEALARANFEPWFKRPFGFMPFWVISPAHHMLGSHSAELAEVQRGRRHYPNDTSLRVLEACALVALGRLDDLSRLVEDSLSQPDGILFSNAGSVLHESAVELSCHGQEDAALTMARRAVAWFRARLPDATASLALRAALGRALFLAREWDEARVVFEDVAGKDTNSIEATGYLGVLAALRADRAAAQAASEKLRSPPRRYLFGQHTVWRAAIAAHRGDKDEAVALLREAFAQGLTHGMWLHCDPTLGPLRGYPPFNELVRPKG